MRRLYVGLFGVFCSVAVAQQTTSPPLTLEQQQLFDAARKDFAEHHSDLALEKMKQLHAMVPDNRSITDGTAETAITLGQDDYALSILKPWNAAHPEDWRALEWTARAYAESGNSGERDKAIAAVLKLHQTSTDPQFQRADRFIAEHVTLPNGGLDIVCALVPFSPYHIYMLGRQTDANNALVQQITLESNDADQIVFAKEHPDLAAKGERRFSMDIYSASRPGPNGTSTQSQSLIGFIDGQPAYDDAKARMLKVAGGQAPPIASRSGLPVPSSK